MFLFDRLFRRHSQPASGEKKTSASTVREPHLEPQAPRQTLPPELLQAQAEAQPRHAPGTRIAYHPELIDQLEQDHRDLLRIFAGLRGAADGGRLDEAAERLDVFRHALQGHLLKENVKLYVYLEHALGSDSISHDLMHNFRHEMDRIGKTVIDFLDRYRAVAEHPEWQADFSRELESMGRVLMDRMRNEESSLYPLYGPV